MADLIAYPKTTPKADDLIIGTVTPVPNSAQLPVTRNFEINALADLIVSETSGITGSGTVNTIAMFTPTGVKIGDSVITQASLGQGINVNANLVVADDFTVAGSIQCNQGLTVEGISTFNDDATFENAVTINDALYDMNSSSGTVGQILTSNGFDNVEWANSTDVVSGAVAKLIPFQVTASAGGSSTYSADNNIVEIGWTGGNGTYVLNIPSAATIPYRNIRFVTNSTFPNGASDKVQITAQSGETIDGAAFFEISKIYEGVSIWSNGTEWIVIQAKAH